MNTLVLIEETQCLVEFNNQNTQVTLSTKAKNKKKYIIKFPAYSGK